MTLVEMPEHCSLIPEADELDRLVRKLVRLS
jgi:hypothetical protein